MMSRQPAIETILGAVVGLLILAGCSQQAPTVPGAPAVGGGAKSADQTLINGFLVQYDGRSFDGEQTTFGYTVSGTGESPPLTDFRLELPGPCSGYEIAGAVYVDADADGERD